MDWVWHSPVIRPCILTRWCRRWRHSGWSSLSRRIRWVCSCCRVSLGGGWTRSLCQARKNCDWDDMDCGCVLLRWQGRRAGRGGQQESSWCNASSKKKLYHDYWSPGKEKRCLENGLRAQRSGRRCVLVGRGRFILSEFVMSLAVSATP